MTNQSTQTDPHPVDTDDTIACHFLQCCGPAAVEANYQTRPYYIEEIHFVKLSEHISSDLPEFVEHKFQKEKHHDTQKLSKEIPWTFLIFMHTFQIKSFELIFSLQFWRSLLI